MRANRSHFRIFRRKKSTSWVVGKRTPAQVGQWLVDKAEFAQSFSLLGVFGVLEQQRAVRGIHIALGRSHGLLDALDLVAVSLPNLGGVDACHGFTLLKPQPCTQGSGLYP